MIISKQNALVKEIKSLHDKKFRDRLGVYVVEGIKPVKEAIELGLNIRDVVVTDKVCPLIPNHDRTVVVSDAVFEYLSEEVTPQGAMAIVIKSPNVIKSPTGNCLLLDGVSDPSNVGAIIRTAAAAGYKDVYMTCECADPYSQKAVRSSMSCIFRVNVMRGELDALLENITLPLVVADMDGQNAFNFNTDGDICLVIGNEGRGVSERVREKAKYTVSIPMENGVESLNAAVSAGILMYGLKKKA